jgi:tetratricopeptide (TPR) repeat protein
VAESLHKLANVLRSEGKPAETEVLLREALAMRTKLLGAEHPHLVTTIRWLASVLWYQGRLAEAEGMYREELKIRRKKSGSDDREVATLLNWLGMVLHRQGKLTEAEGMLRESLNTRKKLLGPEHEFVASSGNNLAGVLIAQDKLSEAEALLRSELELLERKQPDNWVTFRARSLFGRILMGEQHYTEAEPFLVSGYKGLTERKGRIPLEYRRELNEAERALLRLYRLRREPEKAAELTRQKQQERLRAYRKGGRERKFKGFSMTSIGCWQHATTRPSGMGATR